MDKEETENVLKKIQDIQLELELVRVHCIELEKYILCISHLENK